MAITGSDKAYRYAISGVARSGASRSGYTGGGVFIGIGAAQARTNIQYGSLSIVDNLDEAPNRCTFTLITGAATLGQEVVITLGSVNNGERLFAGHVLTVERHLGGTPDQVRAVVSCVDYTWQLGFMKVTERYTTQSATTIAAHLVAKYTSGNGFTSAGVAANLPTVDEITFTNEDLPDAFTRLARRIGGYWYVDYTRGVHLFITPEVRNGDPRPLTPSHPTLAIDGFADALDRSQALTRVYVEGRGSRALGAVAAGDTMIPLEAVDMFAAAADVFVKVSFQGAEGAAQHVSYAGVVNVPGVGSLVGPGNGPPGAPTVAVAAGTGLPTGTFGYAYSDVTPSGESLPGPMATITTGGLPAPGAAPTVAAPTAGGLIPAGVHQWGVTFKTAAGETTPGPLSAVVTTGGPSIPNPTVAPTGSTPPNNYFANLVEDGFYKIKYAYATDTAAPPANVTVASPPSASIQANNSGGAANNAAIAVSIPCSADPAVKYVHVYRTTNGGSTFYRGSLAANVPGTFFNYAGTVSDATIVTQGTEPGANTTPTLSTVALSAIPLGGAGVTQRAVYRTSNGIPLKLLATIPDNTTTTLIDTFSSVSTEAPTANTAAANQVAVSNIAPGPSPTTRRNIYRTTVNGSAATLKLDGWFLDNTSTSYTDFLADASLGAAAPTGDTSALQVPAGSVAAGAPSLIVANVSVFPAAGGWVIIGNGEQVIRYTAKSATAITGIPATGIGAIKAAVAYNSTVTIAPMLTGIPATGARALARPLAAGDEVYLVVQVDDTARQAQLAAAMGGTGIREEWVQDRRLSIGEARARGRATLTVRALSQDTLRYRCRDLLTAAGKSITVTLPAPLNLNTVYKIQTVTIDNFRPYPTQYPTYTVEASSARFSFEDWLRALRTKE